MFITDASRALIPDQAPLPETSSLLSTHTPSSVRNDALLFFSCIRQGIYESHLTDFKSFKVIVLGFKAHQYFSVPIDLSVAIYRVALWVATASFKVLARGAALFLNAKGVWSDFDRNYLRNVAAQDLDLRHLSAQASGHDPLCDHLIRLLANQRELIAYKHITRWSSQNNSGYLCNKYRAKLGPLLGIDTRKNTSSPLDALSRRWLSQFFEAYTPNAIKEAVRQEYQTSPLFRNRVSAWATAKQNGDADNRVQIHSGALPEELLERLLVEHHIFTRPQQNHTAERMDLAQLQAYTEKLMECCGEGIQAQDLLSSGPKHQREERMKELFEKSWHRAPYKTMGLRRPLSLGQRIRQKYRMDLAPRLSRLYQQAVATTGMNLLYSMITQVVVYSLLGGLLHGFYLSTRTYSAQAAALLPIPRWPVLERWGSLLLKQADGIAHQPWYRLAKLLFQLRGLIAYAYLRTMWARLSNRVASREMTIVFAWTVRLFQSSELIHNMLDAIALLFPDYATTTETEETCHWVICEWLKERADDFFDLLDQVTQPHGEERQEALRDRECWLSSARYHDHLKA